MVETENEEPKHPDVVAFIATVMRRTETRSPSELRAFLGEPWTTNRDQERKLYKWHRGETAPSFYSTLELLKAAGMLNESAEAAQVRARPPAGSLAAATERRLRSLEETVQKQGRDQVDALSALAAEVRELARPGVRSARRASQKKS